VLDYSIPFGDLLRRRKLGSVTLAIPEAERVNCVSLARRESEECCRIETSAQKQHSFSAVHTF
jgi:hypothetical protein